MSGRVVASTGNTCLADPAGVPVDIVWNGTGSRWDCGRTSFLIQGACPQNPGAFGQIFSKRLFFLEVGKQILKFKWKQKGPSIAKITLTKLEDLQ